MIIPVLFVCFALNFLFIKLENVYFSSVPIAMGGERSSPINESESLQKQYIVYNESRAFEERNPSRFYFDMSVTYRTNHQNYSGIWALQVKNLLASPVFYNKIYNYKTNSIEDDVMGFPIPSASYKIEF